MVEFAIIAGVMVMLFLGIWYLGKFHDMQAATIQAARYSVWERTVLPPSVADSKIEQQTRARLFGWNRNPLRAADGLNNGANWADQSAQWRDHAGSVRLITKPSDVTVATAASALPGKAAGVVSQVFGVITKGLGGISGGEQLNQGGYFRGSVSVKVADIAALPAPLDKLNLRLNESQTLVTDSWDASGPRQAAMRTRSFTPVAVFAQVTDLIEPVTDFLAIIEEDFEYFEPGKICPDIVPADRLGNGARNIPMYRNSSQCY